MTSLIIPPRPAASQEEAEEDDELAEVDEAAWYSSAASDPYLAADKEVSDPYLAADNADRDPYLIGPEEEGAEGADGAAQEEQDDAEPVAMADPYGAVTEASTEAAGATAPAASRGAKRPAPAEEAVVGLTATEAAAAPAATRASAFAGEAAAAVAAAPPRKAQKTQAQAQTRPPHPVAVDPALQPGAAAAAGVSPAAALLQKQQDESQAWLPEFISLKKPAPVAAAAATSPAPAPAPVSYGPTQPGEDALAADEADVEVEGPLPELLELMAEDQRTGPEPEELDPLEAGEYLAEVPEVDDLDARWAVAEEAPEDGQVETELVWDEKIVVVRHGQVHIELQHQNPPLRDAQMLQFCSWLGRQMPFVVQNYPFVMKSGAHVDLSDNVVGPEGLDKLFRVLREHRVPVVVLKAYRNLLDDSIVDTLIEYLYTQPEAFPMHGIHISHNNITDKGAFRLIRAAAKCGHYPRLTTRLPLWLRLECNNIENPQKIINDCLEEKFNVCLMGDGLCSRPDCNHHSNVHVQLPYFFHQSPRLPVPKAQFQRPGTRFFPRPVGAVPGGPLGPPPSEDTTDSKPDWMRFTVPQTVLMVPAPKKQATNASQPGSEGTSPPLPKSIGAQVVVRPSASGPAPPPGPPPGLQQCAMPGTWAKANTAAVRPSWLAGRAPDGAFQPEGGWGGGRKGGGRGAGRGGWRDAGGMIALGNNMQDGKGGYKGGGRGRRGQMWVGPALNAKVKKDLKLPEGEANLGFEWRSTPDSKCPLVVSVDPSTTVGAEVKAGDRLLRINGLDTAMFTEKQISDMLRQRPLALRFGDE